MARNAPECNHRNNKRRVANVQISAVNIEVYNEMHEGSFDVLDVLAQVRPPLHPTMSGDSKQS